MEGRKQEVLYYTDLSGRCPFRNWRTGITDEKAKAAIDARIARFRGGNFGDSAPIGAGASESRIDLGPGFRIYYGRDDDTIVLLCGGDKSTQPGDIRQAKIFWTDYKKRKSDEDPKRVVANARLQRRPSKRFKKKP
jgi:putative addiction module killer protein